MSIIKIDDAVIEMLKTGQIDLEALKGKELNVLDLVALPKPKTDHYFTSVIDGKVVYFDYETVGNMVASYCPELVGKHIFQQIKGLGLSKAWEKAESPVSLPYSFSDYAK